MPQLTDTRIRALKPKPKPFTVADDHGQRGHGRLSLRVKPNGSKSWFYTYYMGGRKKRLGLGTYPATSLADARQRAQEQAGRLQAGEDPQEARRGRQEARYGTLGELLADYIKSKQRASSSVEESLERYVCRPFPLLILKEARVITSGDIRDILARMLKAGVTTHTNRVRSYLSAAFTHGMRADNDPTRTSAERYGIKSNPVAAVPAQAAYERIGVRWLGEDEVRALWEGVSSATTPIIAGIIRLSILTGARPGELRRLRWADYTKPDLTIPADINKTRLPLVLPLGEMGQQVLRDLHPITGEQEFLFASRRGNGWTGSPITATVLAREVKRLSSNLGMDALTPRDLRRTAKTLMLKSGLDEGIVDRIQGHNLTAGVSRKHYNRHSYYMEKAEALAHWETWLAGVLAENIIPIRRAS